MKWQRSQLDARFAYRAVLASADAAGTIVIWDVREGFFTMVLQDGGRPIAGKSYARVYEHDTNDDTILPGLERSSSLFDCQCRLGVSSPNYTVPSSFVTELRTQCYNSRLRGQRSNMSWLCDDM